MVDDGTGDDAILLEQESGGGVSAEKNKLSEAPATYRRTGRWYRLSDYADRSQYVKSAQAG